MREKQARQKFILRSRLARSVGHDGFTLSVSLSFSLPLPPLLFLPFHPPLFLPLPRFSLLLPCSFLLTVNPTSSPLHHHLTVVVVVRARVYEEPFYKLFSQREYIRRVARARGRNVDSISAPLKSARRNHFADVISRSPQLVFPAATEQSIFTSFIFIGREPSKRFRTMRCG